MTNLWPLGATKDYWDALPELAKEWITKIVVTVVIAVAWHWWNTSGPNAALRRTDPQDPSTVTGGTRRAGISRQVLDPLPDDLVLEERVGDNDKNETKEVARRVSPEDAKPEDTKVEDTMSAHVAAADGEDTSSAAITVTEEQQPISAHEESRGRTVRRPTDSAAPRPVFRNKFRDHPGLEAFWRWCDIECSLFRVYTLGYKSGEDAIPPFVPRSRRGETKISLRVTNRTDRTILVYWVDHKGFEDLKGRIAPTSQWTHQTWTEHPWVFRDEKSGDVLLHYVPERMIPTCEKQSTVDKNDPTTGIHRFSFRDPLEVSPYVVQVDDPVLPFPAREHFESVESAVDFALLHMHRMGYTGWDILVKYLTNILYDPANGRYRQIRIANSTFFQSVWQTPARGLLLALGFVEQGAYTEMGTAKPLTRDQVRMLSTVLLLISQTRGANAMDDTYAPNTATVRPGSRNVSLADCRILLWPLSTSDRPGYVLGWRYDSSENSKLRLPCTVIVAGILEYVPPNHLGGCSFKEEIYARLVDLRTNQCYCCSSREKDVSCAGCGGKKILNNLQVLAWYDPNAQYAETTGFLDDQTKHPGESAAFPNIRCRRGASSRPVPYIAEWTEPASSPRQIIFYDNSGKICYQDDLESSIPSDFSKNVLDYISAGSSVMTLVRGENLNLSPVGRAEVTPLNSTENQSATFLVQLICASFFLRLVWRSCTRHESIPLESILSLHKSVTQTPRRATCGKNYVELSTRRKLRQSVVYWDQKLRAFLNFCMGILVLWLLKEVFLESSGNQALELVIDYIHWQSKLIQDGTKWLESFPVGFKLNEPLTQHLGIGIRSIVVWHEIAVVYILRTLPLLLASPWWYAMLALVTVVTGVVGLLALLTDVIGLLHVHVWFLSSVFSKVFQCEFFLLAVTWRVFRGKKKNVLRSRTDSMQYDSIQLLLGSILFAVALFLFTTIFVYFLFFAVSSMAVSTMLTVLYTPILAFRTWPAGSLVARLLHRKWYARMIYLTEEESPIPSVITTTLHTHTDGVLTLFLRFVKKFSAQVLALWTTRMAETALFHRGSRKALDLTL